MERYGDFAPSVIKLEDDWQSVRQEWNDPTAQTYECMNDNIITCTQHIWAHHVDANECLNVVRDNYNESDIDSALNEIYYRVSEV